MISAQVCTGELIVTCGMSAPLFNGCAKLLDIGSNWNMLSHTLTQSYVLTRVKTLTEHASCMLPQNLQHLWHYVV